MATERRKISRNKVMKVYAYIVLFLLWLFGFVIGRITAPEKVVTETVTEYVTETITVTVETKPTSLDESDVFYYDVPLSKSLQKYIYEICADEEVPVSLILAMIEHESSFNQEAVSSTGDSGLMQINKVNYEMLEEEYRCDDMFNPYQNVFSGVKIINKYIDKYEGDYGKALMAYNMGDYGANKAWQNGITSTKYSTSILELMQKYEEVTDND
jgi:soluble lytic murein transglycosylase-like protein